MIFAVFDVLVTACINCSFVHLYLQFYYSLGDISYFDLYSFMCLKAVFIGSIIWLI